jgi:radical SAM superfamily enzyme YgiQ (UPF0313 family)
MRKPVSKEPDSGQNAPGKILLILLPFWDPQIPPLGISCLKSFIQQHGYTVKAVDMNTESEFRELYYDYYEIIKKYVPGNRRGNLFNTGNVVLRNHMMAHLNYRDEDEYIKLVRILVLDSFDCDLNDSRVRELNKVIAELYILLKKYLNDLLDKENPSVLGLSVFSGTLPTALFAAKLAKEKNPQIKTLLGGGVFSDQLAAGSPDLDYMIEETADYVDHIIVGEGEVLFLELLQGKLPELQKVFTLIDISQKTLGLDSVNIPDYSVFDLSYYPHIAAYGSRSCPFQCSFCSETVNWGVYRKKKAKQLVDEFCKLHQQYSYQLFMLTDSLLNPIITDLANEVLERNVSIYWDGFLRADKPVCSIENTLLWRRGGFYRAKLGIESGSEKVLDAMGKKITIQQIREAVSALAFAGIKTTAFWVVGHPGETEADFRMTLDLIEELKDKIYEADVNPFYYHLSGQVNSDQWMDKNKAVLLYPGWAREMLVSQTWRLDCEPTRKETMTRVNRLVQHCVDLGIPNPYSMDDIIAADNRWQKLHKNSVPPLLELRNKNTRIDESKNVKQMSFASNPLQDEEDWL